MNMGFAKGNVFLRSWFGVKNGKYEWTVFLTGNRTYNKNMDFGLGRELREDGISYPLFPLRRNTINQGGKSGVIREPPIHSQSPVFPISKNFAHLRLS